ncbi:hypothetical protein C2845_PM01G09180 [Panicum miliaceum]|uniref:Uncharacterized protein n=1 Tax=Panicum miliaceum TaxID=4540 RepID=A0A3L6TQY8_PANMI|nr:hypothetical protein C2845_PM01G09180 [Panicum miliaceum]
MSSAPARALKSASRAAFSWKPTIPRSARRRGGRRERWWPFSLRWGSTRERAATLIPTHAGEARLAAEVGNAEPLSQLCTTLRRGEGGGPRVRTVDLLSAMEVLDVDNSHGEVSGGERDDCFVAAFPSSQICITYGIDFPKVPAIES